MRRQHLTQLLRSLVVATALVGLSTVAVAQGISGTSHDLRTEVGTNGEICIVCHTPHDAMAVTDAPLWNHTVTTATFTPYDSPTMDAVAGQPAGASLLCLSCHDGSVAIDALGGGAGTGGNVIAAAFQVGTDLTYDHPISIDYNAGDTGLNPDSGASGLGGTIAEDMLFAGNVECASCHDPHDAAGVANFLVKSNAASALCLTCHNK
jgi:predicted CXXCH cytochrome family protein